MTELYGPCAKPRRISVLPDRTNAAGAGYRVHSGLNTLNSSEASACLRQ